MFAYECLCGCSSNLSAEERQGVAAVICLASPRTYFVIFAAWAGLSILFLALRLQGFWKLWIDFSTPHRSGPRMKLLPESSLPSSRISASDTWPSNLILPCLTKSATSRLKRLWIATTPKQTNKFSQKIVSWTFRSMAIAWTSIPMWFPHGGHKTWI